MELLYVHCIRMGYAKLEQTSPSEYSIRMDSWSDVLVYEMSFLCSDVVLLLYLVILARSIMYRNLTLNLAIQAANWTVGMILGFSAAVTSIVGTQTMLEYSGLEVLGNLAVGTLLCLLAYALAVAIQVQCLFPQPDADDEKARDSTMLVAAQFV